YKQGGFSMAANSKTKGNKTTLETDGTPQAFLNSKLNTDVTDVCGTVFPLYDRMKIKATLTRDKTRTMATLRLDGRDRLRQAPSALATPGPSSATTWDAGDRTTFGSGR